MSNLSQQSPSPKTPRRSAREGDEVATPESVLLIDRVAADEVLNTMMARIDEKILQSEERQKTQVMAAEERQRAMISDAFKQEVARRGKGKTVGELVRSTLPTEATPKEFRKAVHAHADSAVEEAFKAAELRVPKTAHLTYGELAAVLAVSLVGGVAVGIGGTVGYNRRAARLAAQNSDSAISDPSTET